MASRAGATRSGASAPLTAPYHRRIRSRCTSCRGLHRQRRPHAWRAPACSAPRLTRRTNPRTVRARGRCYLSGPAPARSPPDPGPLLAGCRVDHGIRAGSENGPVRLRTTGVQGSDHNVTHTMPSCLVLLGLRRCRWLCPAHRVRSAVDRCHSSSGRAPSAAPDVSRPADRPRCSMPS